MSQGILIFVFAILFIVMVHESGHFLVAKLFGFKATKFFVGMGPTLWSTHKGETEYGIKALPIGGFVKIVGMSPYEEVPPEDQPRSYPNKPRWQRALVIVAGSATHWVLAFVILVVTTMTIGFPTDRGTTKIDVVEEQLFGYEMPAGQIGLTPGDRIVAVGGDEVTDWREVLEYIRAHGGETATFTVVRAGTDEEEAEELSVRLGYGIFDRQGLVSYAPADSELTPVRRGGEIVGYVPLAPGTRATGFLGVQPELVYEKEGLAGAVATAGSRTWTLTAFSFRSIGDVFGMVFDGRLWNALQGEGERDVDEGPCGIVCAGRVVGSSAEQGRYLDVIGFIVGFTVFIGLMNLLPLPPLDGGHLAVLAWERITGRAVDVRKLVPIAAAVISFFVVLFVAVLYLDLARPIRFPF